ncbi:MAG: DJ-1/PfpI family protein [Chromatiales bacterium]|nr:DJ-1/PfpI family protein [Chromatiales bacterium]
MPVTSMRCFPPGGHGPLWDLSADPVPISLIEGFIADGKPVAAVCHAPAVLVNAKSGPGWRTALSALTRTQNNQADLILPENRSRAT